MLIACGTRTFTRQYGAEVGAGVVAGVAERIVTGGPSATSVTEPMPALPHAVTGETASACDPYSDAITAPAAIKNFGRRLAAPLCSRRSVSMPSSFDESAREPQAHASASDASLLPSCTISVPSG